MYKKILFLSLLFLSLLLYTNKVFSTCESSEFTDSLKLNQLLKKGNILIFGELHGTKEVPKAIFHVVCKAIKKNMRVSVGFEHPTSLNTLYDDLYEKKPKKTLKDLLSNWWWQHKVQGGKRSESMFELMDMLITINKKNSLIDVFAFDATYEDLLKEGLEKRELIMSKNISQQIDSSNTIYIVLTGNIHSRTLKGVPWDKNYKSMGYFLSEKKLNNVHSVLFRHNGGYAWICESEGCGKKKIKPFNDSNEKIGFSKSNGDNKHTWNWNIGLINSSPPIKNNKNISKEILD